MRLDDGTELVAMPDIATRLQMSRQRVHVLADGPGFPAAAGRIRRTRVWRWSAVERWAVETGRLAAREVGGAGEAVRRG